MKLFFAFCVLALIPAESKSSGKFSQHLRLMLDYDGCEQKVIAWHRAELEKLDCIFVVQKEIAGLVLARAEAFEKETDLFDWCHPDLSKLEPSRSRRVALSRGAGTIIN